MEISIVGSGVMGTGLTQLFAECQSVERINWILRGSKGLDAKMSRLFRRWEGALKKEKITHDQIESYRKKISPSFGYEAIGRSTFVLEAVVEDIEIKKTVFEAISANVAPNTVMATNTSSLSVTEISLATRFPNKVIGMHFFNPAPVMQLNEIVSGALTDEETRCFASDLSKLLGKTPIYVNESPGFVVNRMLIPMINEAVCIYAEGVATASDIDASMCLGANHPIGPLSLADLIGTDVCLYIMDVLFKETGDTKYRAHPCLRKLVRAGHLGRKSKRGFFQYA